MAIVDIALTAAEHVVAEVNQAGGTCIGLGGDVTDYPGMEHIVAEIIARWGRLDILVNNAGINTSGGRVPLH